MSFVLCCGSHQEVSYCRRDILLVVGTVPLVMLFIVGQGVTQGRYV